MIQKFIKQYVVIYSLYEIFNHVMDSIFPINLLEQLIYLLES